MLYHIPRPAARPGGRDGFTLAELLVVMLIMGLLMGILFPILGVVRQKMQAARSNVRKETIAQGIVTYKMVHRDRYPGQSDPQYWEVASYNYTGSQVLAAHLYGYYDETDTWKALGKTGPYWKIEEDNPEPASVGYSPYEAGMLMDIGSDKNFLSDFFSSPKPFAYYPSAPGVGRLQFVFEMNDSFTGSTSTALKTNITDDRYGTSSDTPFNDGEFLLIGAGPDRRYFTPDDIHNWTN